MECGKGVGVTGIVWIERIIEFDADKLLSIHGHHDLEEENL